MLRLSRSITFAATCILLVLFVSYLFNYLSPNTVNVYIVDDKITLAMEKFRNCVTPASTTYRKNSKKFFEVFASCIKKHIAINVSLMDNLSNGVYNEKKMFLPLSDDYPQDQCKWLTIGVGGVETAERLLKRKYPECQVFGVEPADAGNFSSIGTLIPYGVGKLIHSYL